MEMVGKTKKNGILKAIIIMILIGLIITVIGFAYARYIQTKNGNTQVQIAQWNFNVTAGSSQNLNIDLADTRYANDTTEVDRTTVAPGTKGALVLNIDATGNQVSLEYDIDLSLTQVPENLIFYSDAEMTNAFLKENGAIHLDGYFLANAENKTASKTIYWQWPIETGSTQTEIDDNDELDSNWIGSDVILGIAATGKQIMGNPDEEYTVTFDLNGGTLTNHGDSTQVTKQVAYGEAYGDLPVPSRAGYRFAGWNGKNKVNLADFVADTEYVKVTENEITIIKTDNLVEFQKMNKKFKLENGVRYVVSANVKGSYTGRIYAFFGISFQGQNRSFSYVSEEDKGGLTIFQNRTGNTSVNMNLISDSVVISNIQVEEGSTATAYEPYYVTDTTLVTQNKNHTLTAIWEPVSNP